MGLILLLAILAVPVLIAIIVGVIFLQVKLSSKSNKWLGLIPSTAILGLSIIVVIGWLLFVLPTTASYSPDSDVISSYSTKVDSHSINSEPFVIAVSNVTAFQIAVHIITIITLFNLPTCILLIIHFSIRLSKKTKKREVDQNASDNPLSQ